MNDAFDDFTRAIARSGSRRGVMKTIGGGLVGMLLSSLGLKTARAAIPTPACGTCQACDLDSGQCGLPCSSASVSSSLCNQASTDGSYLRLVNHLLNSGYAYAGPTSAVQVLQGGTLTGSVLETLFQSNGNAAETARIAYAVDPRGNVNAAAIVLEAGIASYSLTVGPSGDLIQTIATQSNVATQISSATSHAHPPMTPPRSAASSLPAHASSPEGAPTTCETALGLFCTLEYGVVCQWAGDAFCAFIGPESLFIGFIPCVYAVGLLCNSVTFAGCTAAVVGLCDSPCGFNIQDCGGTCCNPCQDCNNNVCVPSANIAACPSGVCCDNQCCAAGMVCQNGTCSNPNSGCAGATCGNFIGGCDGNPDCFCWTSAEGGGTCGQNEYCAGLRTCSSSADCGSGSVCAIGTCCVEPVCLPLCGGIASESSRAGSATRRGGRTASGLPIYH